MQKLFLILFVFFISCNERQSTQPLVLIETRFGEIEIELYPERAPETTSAFLENIKEGIYKNASFYRVLKADQLPTDHNSGLIQGGVYNRAGKKVKSINHESTGKSGLSHTDGTVSMARTKPGTASTEFFICIGDQSSLDSGRRGTADSLGMAAFGKVIKGMKTVRKMQNQKSIGDRFEEPITITKIKNL